MSSGNIAAVKPQDILSQWRAYGDDGRGACLTLDANRLSRIVYNIPGLRINPVIYEKTLQVRFVCEILNMGLSYHNQNVANALEATAAALVYTAPLMKAAGFQEESEWHLIFMPPDDVRPSLDFSLGAIF